MGSDWQGFEKEAKAASGRNAVCGVAKLLTEMAVAEQRKDLPVGATVAVRNTLANADVTASGLRTALAVRLGHDSYSVPSQATIQRHRKGACSCDR